MKEFKKRAINRLMLVDKASWSDFNRAEKIKAALLISFLSITAISLAFAFYITIRIHFAMRDLPDISLLKSYNSSQTTLIYDKDNKPIANTHSGDQDRVYKPLTKISPYLQKAVIAIEDERFYKHFGVDLTGTTRALLGNLKGGSIQGGSTLTQQLIKNSFLIPKRSVNRKIIEATLAVRAERVYEKDEILEMYLNTIYWGNLCYGAEKASWRYFRKSANELNLAEAALLAGIIKAPEGFSPYKYFQRAKLRQKFVLQKMQKLGFITREQELYAQKAPIQLALNRHKYSRYPYFVDYVMRVLREKYGNDTIRRGGLRVYTTIDPVMQQKAQAVLQEHVEKLSERSAVNQGALVTIDIKTGEIRAVLGGVDFETAQFNIAAQSKRQAGSTFKPIVYLTALEHGAIELDTIVLDAPISLKAGNGRMWTPKNWDGKFKGRMTALRALAISRNTPAVRVGMKVGVDRVAEMTKKLGVKGKIPKNLSIMLGSLGVSPVEMANIYATFARRGLYIEPHAIRRVEDINGNTLEIADINPTRVASIGATEKLNTMLQEVVKTGTGKRANIEGLNIAGKTGTTNNIRDIWFTGYTDDIVTAVWVGNDKNTPLRGVFSSDCARLWKAYNESVYEEKLRHNEG